MNDPPSKMELQRLQALRGSGLLRSPPLPELDELCQRARRHFDVAMALVTLIEEDRQVVMAKAGTALDQSPRSVAFCDYTIRTDEVLVVPDATIDPRFASNPLVQGEPFIRFYAGAPLIYVGGVRLGAFCILDTKPRQFSRVDVEDLVMSAEQVVGRILEHEFDAKFGSRPSG
ncbi:GAF domain-containing protein [Rubellimicrobium arenae]|uniref:GAF domain-containing protein n=1 Tax=Rubellimicrobium arenae TaxID=2817372 RepID=UPI001B318941|nr:GAF domain-containing protein [Rubellimicrobium arenae]